jgi:hypothetical protein
MPSMSVGLRLVARRLQAAGGMMLVISEPARRLIHHAWRRGQGSARAAVDAAQVRERPTP